MFWTRPAAIRPILDLGLVSGDFPPGRETLDGSISHAIERLYALAAERAGYTWFKVAAPECYEHKETIYTPRSDADLRAFLAGHERQLMKTMVRTRGLLT
jgi:lipopolysaccharide biosynthesis protein